MYQHTELRKFKVRAGRWLSLILTLALMISLLMIETPTVHADTNVGGPIISDTTWTLANSPYIVVENVEVWEGVTLTIEPGVTVKFDSEKKLQVNGELIAQGTAGNPITFTSNQSSPAPGDWGNIYFTDGSVDATFDGAGNYVGGSILQYCIVEYGGSGSGDSAIYAPSAAPFIDHCTVRNNASRGIRVAGSAGKLAVVTNDVVSGNSGSGICADYSTVTGNTVSDNSGSGISAGYSTVTGNTVSGNSAIRNGGGIYATYSTVSGNVVISNSVVLDGLYDVHGGGIYASYSTVTSNTVRDNSVTGHWARDEDGGGIYAFGSTVIGNTVIGNSTHGYGARGGGIFATRGSVVNRNTVNNNSANDKGGGIYADGRSIVNSNIISGNSVRYGGGIYADYSTVSGNSVSGNSADNNGGGIVASNSPVLTNTVTGNTASNQGAGVYFSGSNDFRANYVVSNTGPISYTIGGVAFNGIPQVHYNNFFDNEPYDVVVLSSSDISGTLNYWGTTESVDILGQIYDWYDDNNRGRFLYLPFLSELYIPPPFGLRADFHEDSIDLSWDSHPYVIAGWGYNLYYDTDTSGPPYEGTGTAGGSSPIDVGDVTSYTLSSLAPDKNYFIALTVYDPEGHESEYSVEVHHDFGLSVTPYYLETPYGSSVTYTVMLTTTTGFHTPVDLGAIGLLDGATAAFEPPSVRPEGSSLLTIMVPPTASATTYPIGVVASKSGITHTATVWLKVLEAPAPSASLLYPSKVPVDTPTDINLYGEGFLPVPTVTVGTTPCSNVTWLDSTHIIATVPAGLPEGTYDVIIENPDSKSYTMYDALTVTSLIWDVYLPLVLKNH